MPNLASAPGGFPAPTSRRSVFSTAIEPLELRRLMAAPQVVAPLPTDPDAPKHDGHFHLDRWHQHLQAEFNQSMSVDPGALSVRNLTLSQELDVPALADADGDGIYTAQLSNESFGDYYPIENGNHEVIVNADLATSGGEKKLDGNRDGVGGDDYVSEFFFLAGDANHDRMVSGDDYSAIDFNAGEEDEGGYFNGDFNYDGTVNGSDYSVIDFAMGTVLPPPPDEPNELSATAGRGYITLPWTAPEDVDVDGFNIYRSTDGGVTFELHHALADPFATSWTDEGLEDGTKYTYRIRAYSDSDGESVTSNKFWSVTNLPGPGEEATYSLLARNAVTLHWIDNSTNETGYEIEQTAPGGAVTIIPVAAVSGVGSRSHRVTGLSASSSYTFRVRALTAAQASAWSPALTLTTLAEGVPTAPTGLVATPQGAHAMQLTWTDNSDNETGFTVEQRIEGGTWEVAGTSGANEASFTSEGLISLSSYAFRATANGAGGDSDASDPTENVTEQGNGIIYSGSPFDDETFDDVTANWSGPYDRTSPPLRNDTVTLLLTDIPQHTHLKVTFNGGGANASGGSDEDRVTLTFGSESDDYVMDHEEVFLVGMQVFAEHTANSATITIAGSGFEDHSNGSFADNWGIDGIEVMAVKIKSMEFWNPNAPGATISNALPTPAGNTTTFNGILVRDTQNNRTTTPGFNYQYKTAAGAPAPPGLSVTHRGPNGQGAYEFDIAVPAAYPPGAYDIVVTIQGVNKTIRRTIHIQV